MAYVFRMSKITVVFSLIKVFTKRDMASRNRIDTLRVEDEQSTINL